jgi:hypothetical protein
VALSRGRTHLNGGLRRRRFSGELADGRLAAYFKWGEVDDYSYVGNSFSSALAERQPRYNATK